MAFFHMFFTCFCDITGTLILQCFCLEIANFDTGEQSNIWNKKKTKSSSKHWVGGVPKLNKREGRLFGT